MGGPPGGPLGAPEVSGGSPVEGASSAGGRSSGIFYLSVVYVDNNNDGNANLNPNIIMFCVFIFQEEGRKNIFSQEEGRKNRFSLSIQEAEKQAGRGSR